MGKHLSSVKLTETLTLSTCTDGIWLYDKTRGMNLSMKAQDERAAFVEALGYYQRRLAELERVHRAMSEKVYTFVEQFIERDDG